jgi:hypothetical protein
MRLRPGISFGFPAGSAAATGLLEHRADGDGELPGRNDRFDFDFHSTGKYVF